MRDCGRVLAREDRRLACGQGHSFDRAREGYFNLLQPQDRRSRQPGDSLESVQARHRWLASGHAEPLARAIDEAIGQAFPHAIPQRDAAPSGEPARVDPGAAELQVLDIGCGDGWFLERLARGRAWSAFGLDLSAAAIRMASRRVAGPGCVHWIVANADRGLPFADRSLDLVLSLFGRRPSGEIRRVLRDDGRLIVAVPGEGDLAELRQAILGQAEPFEGGGRAERELDTDFACIGARDVRWRVALDAASAGDALAMTYRGQRRSERDRRVAGGLPAGVTLSADLRVFAKRVTWS